MADYRSYNNYPKGLRDNNPINLRPYGFTYQHQVSSDSDNEAIFDSTIYGLRAAALDLYTAYYIDGRHSISDIISVFAPPSENDTNAYINYVANQMNISPDADINLNGTVLLKLIRAMMQIEIGEQYAAMIPDEDIKTGIILANKQELIFAGSSGVGLLLLGAFIFWYLSKRNTTN
jgi:hypothetical protein